jgi:uncharacterized phage-associated protein
MPAPYSATTVANRFIELAAEHDQQLTPMKLIKLVYIAHGWTLSLLGHGLVAEPVEAWRYGPVVPSLYQRVKGYGRGAIRGRLPNTIFDRNTGISPEDDSIIVQVFEKYGRLSGVQLSHLTHRVGTPWHTVYQPGEYGVEIPDQVIKSHYDTMRAVA